MNAGKRTAIISDIHFAYVLAKMEPPRFDKMTNREIRQQSRALGLSAPRCHSNRNRTRQNRQRKHADRVARQATRLVIV